MQICGNGFLSHPLSKHIPPLCELKNHQLIRNIKSCLETSVLKERVDTPQATGHREISKWIYYIIQTEISNIERITILLKIELQKLVDFNQNLVRPHEISNWIYSHIIHTELSNVERIIILLKIDVTTQLQRQVDYISLNFVVRPEEVSNVLTNYAIHTEICDIERIVTVVRIEVWRHLVT